LFHIIGRDKRDALLFRQKASRSCVVQHSKIDLVMPGSGQYSMLQKAGGSYLALLTQYPPKDEIDGRPSVQHG